MTQSMEPNESGLNLPAVPGGPPREVSRRGNLRAWLEPRVRVWWMLAGVLAGLGAYFLSFGIVEWREDSRLIDNGKLVEAEIVEVDSPDGRTSRKGLVLPPEAHALFTFRIELDGKEHRIKGRLKEQKEPLGPGKRVLLHVDPSDPNQWTDRQAVTLSHYLMVGVLAVPPVCMLLAWGVYQHIQVLRVWKEGQAMAATVVETKQAATAPLSRIVRYMLADSRDGRVYTAVVPVKARKFEAGEAFWIVAPPGRPEKAIVAMLYDQ